MPYTVIATELPDVLIFEPKVFGDERGLFFESYRQRDFQLATGLDAHFVQDNHSRSGRGVLRGLHYQIQQPQGKLIRVVRGEVFDVVVDLGRKLKTFGRWEGEVLSGDNKRQLWVPEGFAHGFVVLSDTAELLYKATDYYAPAFERCILWSDATLNIAWPAGIDPILSRNDSQGNPFNEAEVFA